MITDPETALDNAHQTINDQEEAICELNHKLLEMTDARDMALGKAIELINALRRIECLQNCECSEIARRAIDDYSGK